MASVEVHRGVLTRSEASTSEKEGSAYKNVERFFDGMGRTLEDRHMHSAQHKPGREVPVFP
jgi:hypothetical protein